MAIETMMTEFQVREIYDSLRIGSSADLKKCDMARAIRKFNFNRQYIGGCPETLTFLSGIEAPMLCSRYNELTDARKHDIWRDDTFIAQEKLDGIRCSLIYDNGVFLWSRENDRQTLLPKTISIQIPATNPYLLNSSLKGKFKSFAIDCELVHVNGITALYQAVDRHQGESGLCLYALDLLSLNGKSFLDAELSERLSALNELMKSLSVLGVKLPATVATHKLAFFLNQVEKEGVVLKSLSSKYSIKGSRSRKGWIKVKHSIDKTSLIEDSIEGFITDIQDNGDMSSELECSAFIEEDGVSTPIAHVYTDRHMQKEHYLGGVVEFKSQYFDVRQKCFFNPTFIRIRSDKRPMDCRIPSKQLERWSA